MVLFNFKMYPCLFLWREKVNVDVSNFSVVYEITAAYRTYDVPIHILSSLDFNP